MGNEELIAEIKRKVKTVQMSSPDDTFDELMDSIMSEALNKARAEGRRIGKESVIVEAFGEEDVFEAGRQSALAEIESLHKEIDKLNKNFTETVNELTSTIRNIEAEKQEQVRLLREDLSIFPNGIIEKIIAKRFPDCAEQPKPKGKMITSVEVYDEKYLKKVL